MKNKDQDIKKPVFKTATAQQVPNQKTQNNGFEFNQEHEKPATPKAEGTTATVVDKNAAKELEAHKKEIAELKAKLEQFNLNFKKEVEQRSAKAQEILNQKVKEITEKSNEEIKLAKKYAIKDNAEELINIISQMKVVIDASENNPNEAVRNYVVGFKMYMNMFDNLLANMGIKPIPVKVGDSFDEKIMEAVDTEKGSVKANCVARVVKQGYFLHDRVLIHTQVVVGK